MARANLKIAAELTAAFESACANGAEPVRVLRASIEGERIVCGAATAASGSAEDDFEVMAAEKVSPQYYIWNEDPSESGNWCLIAYVTANCKVRDKMLYASCHKDLVNTLGATLFKGECYVNDAEDFTHASILDAMRSSLVNAPLTEAEELRAAEAKASIGQDTVQSGLATLPFQLTPSCADQLKTLKAGGVNFVSMLVDSNEKVDVAGDAKALETSGDLVVHMDSEQGRFYALRYPVEEGVAARLFFVLCVPDATPIKQRMILATVKSTVLERCSALGLAFTKMLEVQDAADIVSDLQGEIATFSEDRSLKNEVAFSKPKGPPGRRGKRRMMKKKK